MQIYSKSMKNATSIQKSQQICTWGGDVYYASRKLLSTCFVGSILIVDIHLAVNMTLIERVIRVDREESLVQIRRAVKVDIPSDEQVFES